MKFVLYSPATKLLTQVLDADFVEHDAYILFDKLMTFGKSWYEFNDDVSSRKSQVKAKVSNPNHHSIFLRFYLGQCLARQYTQAH